MASSQPLFTPLQIASITSLIHQVLQEQQYQPVTQSVTQPANHRVTSEQKKKRNEKTRRQYKRKSLQVTTNEEKCTEKEVRNSSDSEAITTKNQVSLSAFPRQLLSAAPQQSGHHDTHHSEAPISIWPGISACAMIWSTTELSKQEKDLLERSQPNHHENEQHPWAKYYKDECSCLGRLQDRQVLK